ncbi:MAG: PhnD/SsuA/transferrin family substrate-binding protein [Candidatus Dormibacteraeota bacterium]|uniref:PhnD/SsuA/transferrin family substrate-binding protein n=1 Tax=Candidatus Amunia macphersoniae TaxID=3127014 RepID=A0A934KE20_9BACT|nr:PhnD/SsuA/transferrin family substrate-binding protein [Candidatus Dormibacteraeota bacterium]
MSKPMLVGAVAYTANVVPIWEGMREYFRDSPAEMDFVLYSNYERQVESLLAGHIDIAWNTNLAWVRTAMITEGACRALAMRDIDAAFRTVLVSRAGSAFEGIDALRGKRLALGSRDSAHAAILPMHFLADAGLSGQVEILRFNTDVGKHGDTGRSELDALRAVLDDQADAAALGITTWDAIGRDQLMPGALEVFWTSPIYSHCNFTTLPNLDEEHAQRWVDHLMAMSWDVPEHRRVLEMEGLRQWVTPRLEGYASLFDAVNEQQIPVRW